MNASDIYDYIHGFFGYGSWSSKYWFVGLEEGGVSDIRLFEARIRAWQDLDRGAVVDMHDLMHNLEGMDWFAEDAPLQRTWRALIRTRYAAAGLDPELAEMKRFQREKLGRVDSDTALLELLPLPARGRRPDEPWIYSRDDVPELKSREVYIQAFKIERRARLLAAIAEHRPGAVITYGGAHAWRRAVHASTVVNRKAWAGQIGDTVIVCTHHPEGARSNEHWDEIGRYIRRCTLQ